MLWWRQHVLRAAGGTLLRELHAGWAACVPPATRPSASVQVRELARYLRAQQAQRTERLPLQAATVVRVQQNGMGDRACVDLCR